MKHLDDEQIYRLAEITEGELAYNNQELDMLEHLKICADCFDRFCSVLALLGVTSESGYLTLRDFYGIQSAEKQKTSVKNRVLTVIRVIKEQFERGIGAAAEQIEKSVSMFQFEPVVSLGTRGSTDEEKGICRLEDIDDDKTFVNLDYKKNELFVQINIKNHGITAVNIFLEMESGEKITIPQTKQGSLIKGVLANVPNGIFKLVIEERSN